MSDSASENAEFRVVVLSGPSGSGKTTVVDRLVEHSPVKLVKSISATTRPPRAGEVDGEDYYFLSSEEFQHRREAGEFLECAEVHRSGHWYGTLRSEIERAKRAGGWAFLEIDVEGAMNVVAEYPNAVTVFLTTPSEEVYEQRLRARGTESEQEVQRRLETARKELQSSNRYRFQVVNDDLDRAVAEICEILSREQPTRHNSNRGSEDR